jgi:hypothetical protein
MTEKTPILTSVHTYKDSLLRCRVPLSVVTSIESDCSVKGDMTETTRILNSVPTSNDSLQRRRAPLSVVTSIKVTVANKVT